MARAMPMRRAMRAAASPHRQQSPSASRRRRRRIRPWRCRSRSVDTLAVGRGSARRGRGRAGRAEAALADGNLIEAADDIAIYWRRRARSDPDNAAGRRGARRASSPLVARRSPQLDDDIDSCVAPTSSLRSRATCVPATMRVRDYLEAVDAADRLGNSTARPSRRCARAATKPPAQRARQPARGAGAASRPAARDAGARRGGERADPARGTGRRRRRFRTGHRRWLRGRGRGPRRQPHHRRCLRAPCDGAPVADRAAARRSPRIAAEVRRHRQRRARDWRRCWRSPSPAIPPSTELRERIDLAVHYGMFRPGQRFTDALGSGARAAADDRGAAWRLSHGRRRQRSGSRGQRAPAALLRFDRGFALSVREVTVGDFRRFVRRHRPSHPRRAARLLDGLRRTQRQLRAPQPRRLAQRLRRRASPTKTTRCCTSAPRTRRPTPSGCRSESGQPLPAAERGRIRIRAARRRRHGLSLGRRADSAAGDRQPHRRRRPLARSDAAGRNAFAGATATATGGRRRSRSFAPTRSASTTSPATSANGSPIAGTTAIAARRTTAAAWVNPGCRTQVMRGGSWASAPDADAQFLARAGAASTHTNARLGFRVARDL